MQACSTCGDSVLAGALFCDGCGSTVQQVQIARKLRQAPLTTVKNTSGGLLNPGERIKGRHTYLIEESVAKSGFGATFRAIRLSDEKQILIKQMMDQVDYDQSNGSNGVRSTPTSCKESRHFRFT